MEGCPVSQVCIFNSPANSPRTSSGFRMLACLGTEQSVGLRSDSTTCLGPKFCNNFKGLDQTCKLQSGTDESGDVLSKGTQARQSCRGRTHCKLLYQDGHSSVRSARALLVCRDTIQCHKSGYGARTGGGGGCWALLELIFSTIALRLEHGCSKNRSSCDSGVIL